MNEKETGGPAFPLHPEVRPDLDTEWLGMTMRDYFAAKALQGMLADTNMRAPANEFAERAYALADAMLEARK